MEVREELLTEDRNLSVGVGDIVKMGYGYVIHYMIVMNMREGFQLRSLGGVKYCGAVVSTLGEIENTLRNHLSGSHNSIEIFREEDYDIVIKPKEKEKHES